MKKIKYKIPLLLLLLLLLPSCFIRLVNPPPEPTDPAVKGKSRKPPLPPIMMQFMDPAQQMQAPEVVRELVHDFDIIDQRFTNGLGSLLFSWELDAPNLAGFYLYYGNSNGFIGRLTMSKDVRSYRMDNIPWAPQNHFGLSAFSSDGIEGPFATNTIVWPMGPAPAYTNFVVIYRYRVRTNLNDSGMVYTGRLHYGSQPVGTTMFWDNDLPLTIEGAP